ncbi:CHASE3 domain-containing protein [Streptomyces sp. NPDC051105]|uniref:CHASE3 domain-containing protein n=1 Tax=Streptomyces sp. NPDC051105 TaxID=3154843 RepID=UPI00341C6420
MSDANSSTSARRASRTALVEAGTMERLLLDLETGQRGFVITKHETFLQPWQQARSQLPAAARRFTESATSPDQRRTAERTARGVDSFLKDYSGPLVDMVRRGDPAASSLKTTTEGKERVDTLRAQFAQYMADERAQLAAHTDAAGTNSRQAVLAAAIGLATSTALVAVFTILQHRAVVRPVRRCRTGADRAAVRRGDEPAPRPARGTVLGLRHDTQATCRQQRRGDAAEPMGVVDDDDVDGHAFSMPNPLTTGP